MRELIEILDAMVLRKAEVPDPLELLLDMGERIVKTVSGAFQAKSDEVAILLLTSDRKHLRFIAPRQFVNLGTIPVSKRDSIAVSVLTKKTGVVLNNVQGVRRVAFYESVKIKDRALPIQKMVAAPILHQGEPIGVVQISRKGRTPSESGPEFGPADMEKAAEIFASVAGRLVQGCPERF